MATLKLKTRNGNPATDLPRISQGAITAWMSCPMKAKLSREGLRKIAPSVPLTFGILAHKVIEIVYRDIKEPPKEAVLKKILRKAVSTADFGRASAEKIAMIEDSAAILLRMFPYYFKRWVKDFNECDFDLIEAEFNVPYKNQFIMYGFLDRVFRKKSGLWLADTKTKGRLEDEFITEHLHIDFQFMYYLYALKILTGTAPKGAIMDNLRRPNLKPGKGETFAKLLDRIEEDVAERPTHYFVRYEMVVGKEELLDFEKQLDLIMPQYLLFREGKLPAYKNTTACAGKFNCEYLPICAREDRSLFYIQDKKGRK